MPCARLGHGAGPEDGVVGGRVGHERLERLGLALQLEMVRHADRALASVRSFIHVNSGAEGGNTDETVTLLAVSSPLQTTRSRVHVNDRGGVLVFGRPACPFGVCAVVFT